MNVQTVLLVQFSVVRMLLVCTDAPCFMFRDTPGVSDSDNISEPSPPPFWWLCVPCWLCYMCSIFSVLCMFHIQCVCMCVCVPGGWHGATENTNKVECYDIHKNQWNPCSPMRARRYRPGQTSPRPPPADATSSPVTRYVQESRSYGLKMIYGAAHISIFNFLPCSYMDIHWWDITFIWAPCLCSSHLDLNWFDDVELLIQPL